jgi:hypothetical protein
LSVSHSWPGHIPLRIVFLISHDRLQTAFAKSLSTYQASCHYPIGSTPEYGHVTRHVSTPRRHQSRRRFTSDISPSFKPQVHHLTSTCISAGSPDIAWPDFLLLQAKFKSSRRITQKKLTILRPPTIVNQQCHHLQPPHPQLPLPQLHPHAAPASPQNTP